MANGTFEDLMAILEAVPGNKEERTSLKVMLADQIYKERKALGLTQSQLVELINKNGETINQATISKIESAENDIKINTYEKVINTLGIIVKITGPSEKIKHQSDMELAGTYMELAGTEMQRAINAIRGENILRREKFYTPIEISDFGDTHFIYAGITPKDIAEFNPDEIEIITDIELITEHQKEIRKVLSPELATTKNPSRTEISEKHYPNRVARKNYRHYFEEEINEFKFSK